MDLETARGTLPRSTALAESGHLAIGGCDTVQLARRFGTPLYLYDEDEIRAACRSYRAALVAPWPSNDVHYAAKAYLAPWLCRLLMDEGLGLDVVSGGELYVALTAGVPAARIRFHGNNKSPGELEEACRAGVGAVVVDNLDEIDALIATCRRLGHRQPVLLRLAPGITAHTHVYLQTGTPDSKFGLAIAGGMAAEAARRCLAAHQWLDLRGYHTHIGTQILELEPFGLAATALASFAAEMYAHHGYWPRELSPGGGLAVPYTPDDAVPAPADLAAAVMGPIAASVPAGQALPAVTLEPGRSIVARAGVALYTIGGVKDVAGGVRYALIDGGMADNIRPPLYGARYTLVSASAPGAPCDPAGPVTVAGRYCESGDVLATNVSLPALSAGDVLAVAGAGAYCLPMSSSYNMALRPGVVVVQGGHAHLVERRAAYADLLALDVSSEG